MTPLAKVYRRAAERIASGEVLSCCTALSNSGMNQFEKNDFIKMFRPKSTARAYWYGEFTPRNQMARSLALLIMAEMAEEGSL